MGKQKQGATRQIGRVLKILSGGILIPMVFTGCTSINTSYGKVPHWGEYGGNMQILQSAFQGPQSAGESNFYIDLLGMSLRSMVTAQGLTNNQALFVLSHGTAVMTEQGWHYGYHGNQRLRSYFSPADLARIMGDKAQQVRILVLAGCNIENLFYAQEFKRHFPNATTIIHATPGTDASVISFREMLTYNSAQLGTQKVSGTFFSEFGKPNTRALGPYIAEIFQPGASKPYKQEVAGRELLTGTSVMQTASAVPTNYILRALEATD